MIKSVTGKILFINLSDATSRVEAVPEEFYTSSLSGLGLGVRVLYERIPAGADPLGPHNILGFVAGLLTGTGAMFSGRFLVVGKSPLTGGWGDANCGGNLAPAIKQSGFDGIFIEGAAKSPVYLYVRDGIAEILPADDLWGKDAIETEELLLERHGKRARAACIGPAGENLVRFAGISNDRGRLAGRSGLGAVMGSKRLKALVLEGKTKTESADAAVIKKWSKATADLMPKKDSRRMPAWIYGPLGWVMSRLPTHIRLDGLISLPPFSAWGTASTNELSVINGDAPVRNWRGQPSQYPAKTVGISKIEPRQRKKYHCFACPLGCGAIVDMQGKYTESHRPEYETTTVFGSNLLNRDLDSIFDLNEICNRMGLDSISTGTVIGFAMECYERGLLSDADTGGLKLEWGNPQVIQTLVEQITHRQGIGELLAEGVQRAAERIGAASRPYAIHAGGQELPMHDPRIDPAFGVIYLADPTPGRHTITNTTEYEMFNLWTRVSWAPKPPDQYPKKLLYENSDENARSNAAGAIYKALLDCAGMCLFGAHIGVDRSGFFEMLNAASGLELTPNEYMEIGRRVQDLRQWFNIKHGMEPAEVQINPLVVGQPPAEKGPARGLSFDVYGMRQKFWREMGWDEHNGHPLVPPPGAAR
jgi:aldehyde:ferredoxin oxidoreductase